MANNLLAQELQLKNEEKWILKALKNIRSQRNTLQIERLHLESIRSKLVEASRSSKNETKSETKKQPPDSVPATPNTEDSQPATTPDFDDFHVNQEDLHLEVHVPPATNWQMEEFEDSEEETEDEDDPIIDMDLLMNTGIGNQ